ncbi:MAG: BamA/TamA family outer membrane protein, partial [Proteobacteria bacterium]|nr:BamA/TamA family outer membrane protein [Pseudomonadota bacterium]
ATIKIREGLPHLFNEFQFTGTHNVPPERLTALIHLEKNQVLSKGVFQEIYTKFSEFYNNLGYLDHKIELSVKRQITGHYYATDIHLNIEEGERFKAGSISIFGLQKTKYIVVQRNIMIKPGDFYSPQKLKKTYEKLRNLGLFRSIRFQYADDSTPTLPTIEPEDSTTENRPSHVRNISVLLEETDHGMITFGPGYNLFSGYQYAIETAYNNLFGLGHKILARLSLNERRNQDIFESKTIFGSVFTLEYIFPFVGDLPLDFSLYGSRRISALSYWEYLTLLKQELRYTINRNKKTHIRLFTKQSSSSEIGTDEQKNYFLAESNSRIFAGGITVSQDLRDSHSWPTKGVFYELTYEKAMSILFFHTEYDKWDLLMELYQPAFNQLVWLLSLKFTKFSNIGIKGAEPGYQTLPASEMLQTGGTDSVRGFDQLLGPYLLYTTGRGEEMKRDIMGGTDRIIFSSKLRYPMSDHLALNIFYELGNSFINDTTLSRYQMRFDRASNDLMNTSSSSNNDSQVKPTVYDNYPIAYQEDLIRPLTLLSKLYSSAGLAIDYLTPIGSIGLSLSHPIYQPKSPACLQGQTSFCLDRRGESHPILQRFKFDFTVVARF